MAGLRLIGVGTSLSGAVTSGVVGVTAPEHYPLPLAITVAGAGAIMSVIFGVFELIERLDDRRLAHEERVQARQCEHVERLVLGIRANPDHLSEIAVAWTGHEVSISTSRVTDPPVKDEEEADDGQSEDPTPPALRPAS